MFGFIEKRLDKYDEIYKPLSEAHLILLRLQERYDNVCKYYNNFVHHDLAEYYFAYVQMEMIKIALADNDFNTKEFSFLKNLLSDKENTAIDILNEYYAKANNGKSFTCTLYDFLFLNEMEIVNRRKVLDEALEDTRMTFIACLGTIEYFYGNKQPYIKDPNATVSSVIQEKDIFDIIAEILPILTAYSQIDGKYLNVENDEIQHVINMMFGDFVGYYNFVCEQKANGN